MSPPSKRKRDDATESAPASGTLVRVSSDGASSKLAIMAELWKGETLCNIRVEVQGRTFAAHRLVLASSSDYMRALLCEDRFLDSSEAQITLQDMSANAFKHVLNWMYTDSCDINASDLFEVLEAASRLQCTSLVTKLGAIISGRITAESCLAMWDAAERLGLETLAKKAMTVAALSFDEVRNLDDFKDLSSDKVVELVSSNYLQVAKEEDVYSTVIAWAKAQEELKQAAELEKVIQHVRFPLMAVDFIEKSVETEQLLLDNPACMFHVQHSFKEKLFSKKTERTFQRSIVGSTLEWCDFDRDLDQFCFRIKEDVELVKSLCERPAPGSEEKVNFSRLKMAGLCGEKYVLKSSDIKRSSKYRAIKLDGYFWPFDALEWAP